MSAVVAPRGPRKLTSRTLKVAAAIIAGVAAAVWLALFVSVGGDFYRTVEEANAGGAAADIRVGGRVAADSVVQEGGAARFVLEGESGETLEVRYTGPFPERLRAHEEAVVRGSMESGRGLEATEVLIKCPDGLFPEKITNTVLSGVGLKRLLY
ncbi:MAG TPA: cytochrome c maturation protein CcmE [Thermoleophilia bacterium]|nr:cytochrome c maturation protein CcmE [Thermoleophilia bacterium]